MSPRYRVVRLVAVLVACSGVAGCESLLVEPAERAADASVSFSLAVETGGAAEAFARVDRVYLRFASGDTVRRDTVLHVVQEDAGIRVRLALHTDEQVPALGIYAELRAGDATLFKGAKIVRVEPGVPVLAEVPLLPVPAILTASVSELSLPLVGDTVRLSSAVLFASGDTIPGLAGEWSSENPLIAIVSPSGLVLARAVGQTKLFVRYEGFEKVVPVGVLGPG